MLLTPVSFSEYILQMIYMCVCVSKLIYVNVTQPIEISYEEFVDDVQPRHDLVAIYMCAFCEYEYSILIYSTPRTGFSVIVQFGYEHASFFH